MNEDVVQILDELGISHPEAIRDDEAELVFHVLNVAVEMAGKPAMEAAREVSRRLQGDSP